VLPRNQRIQDDVWEGVVPGGPGIALGDILRKTVAGRSSITVESKLAAAAA
jgi:hypothetical protein